MGVSQSFLALAPLTLELSNSLLWKAVLCIEDVYAASLLIPTRCQ